MNKSIFILIVLLSITYSCFAANASTNKRKLTEISFSEGISKGYFIYKFVGAFDPGIYREFIDKEGIHYGKCMALIIESNIDSTILLKIEAGRLLLPIDTSIQVMIITKTTIIPLIPNVKYATKIYAMCSEIHKYPPFVKTDFIYGAMADTSLVKLARHLESTYLQNMIGQHAIWAYANQVKMEELLKYGADSLSLVLTKKLLDDLNLKTEINKKSIFAVKSDVVEIRKTTLNILTYSILIILIPLNYFLIKQRKRKNRHG